MYPVSTPAAGKILAVLDTFTAERPEQSLSEIARRAGLPLSTGHRLVALLLAWGGLERTGPQGYRVGLHLWELGSLAPRGLGLREVAMPFLEDLYEATHQHVQLAVLDGLEALCVEKISGRGAVRIRTRVGGRLPLHASGVGQVLLAYAGPDLLDRLLEGELAAFTPRTVTDPGRVRAALATVRATGIAENVEEFSAGARSVAAPVRGVENSVVAALSIVLPADSDARGLGAALRTAARGIGRGLGEAGKVSVR